MCPNTIRHAKSSESQACRQETCLGTGGRSIAQPPGLHFWTTFLNQETSFMDGGERIARMMNYRFLL